MIIYVLFDEDREILGFGKNKSELVNSFCEKYDSTISEIDEFDTHIVYRLEYSKTYEYVTVERHDVDL